MMLNKISLSLFLFITILVGAFVARLYRFDNPIADWHSWRQADTSAVSRNFVNQGFDLLHPRFDDLSNVPSGKENPQGYRFVEFPLYNIAQAGAFSLFGVLTLEKWGRLVTIFSSLLSLLFLYLLVKKYAGIYAGLFTAFFYGFLPYNIFYGRVILPDPSMIMAVLAGIYFFDLWIEKSSQFTIHNSQFLLAVLFTASAFLLKPYALIFILPMIYLAWSQFGFSLFKKWQLWVFFIVAILPLVLWRAWMLQYPEGIPVSSWLFNGGNIRFKGAYFYWIFADRIGRLILGYWGLPLFILGILAATKKDFFRVSKGRGFFFSFLVSSLLYLVIIARGNVQHDYYQILIVPSIVIFLGFGAAFLVKDAKQYFSFSARYGLLMLCAIFSFMFGWYFVRDYFNINNPAIVKAGEAVDALIPKDAKIMALYDGDTSFLYQTKRKGWTSFERSLPEMIQMGASYLVLVHPKQEDLNLGKEYKIVQVTSDYLLVNLRKKP